MELDLGEGGKQTDRVRVYHAGARLNNVTLYVMDEKRNTGITDTSLEDLEFKIPAADSTTNISQSETRMVQSLRLTRTNPGINAS